MLSTIFYKENISNPPILLNLCEICKKNENLSIIHLK